MTLDITRTLLEEKGVPILDCVRLPGKPACEILRRVKKRIDPDLIMVEVHNRNAFSNAISRQLLYDAPYNHLIVH